MAVATVTTAAIGRVMNRALIRVTAEDPWRHDHLRSAGADAAAPASLEGIPCDSDYPFDMAQPDPVGFLLDNGMDAAALKATAAGSWA